MNDRVRLTADASLWMLDLAGKTGTVMQISQGVPSVAWDGLKEESWINARNLVEVTEGA